MPPSCHGRIYHRKSFRFLVGLGKPTDQRTTSSDAQRIRLRVLALFVMREMRDLAESRRYQTMDEEYGFED